MYLEMYDDPVLPVAMDDLNIAGYHHLLGYLDLAVQHCQELPELLVLNNDVRAVVPRAM